MSLNAAQDFGQPLVLEDFKAVEQPVTATSPPLCAVCREVVEQFQRCGGCQNIHYCSKNCQVNDWDQHKTLCRFFAKVGRPAPAFRRALCFPPDQTRPRFVWLRYGTNGAPVDIEKCFPNTKKAEIKTIAFHNRFFPYWIQLSYDSNMNGTRAITNNTAIQHAFRGPVVALAYDAEEGLSIPALDVDTTILSPVLEYARLRADYVGPIFVEQPQERYTEEEWNDVMLSCLNRGV